MGICFRNLKISEPGIFFKLGIFKTWVETKHFKAKKSRRIEN